MAVRFRRIAASVLFATLAAFVSGRAPSAMAATQAVQATSARSSAPATHDADLWLEAAFEPAEIYVQAQAVYRLRLYQAIDVRELRLEVPAPALGELRPLGEDRVDETTRDGRRYRVTERRFAVVPFASGEFTLPDARAVGTVAVRGAMPGTRAALAIVAPRVALSVLPIPPEAAPGAWLPARALSLAETWAPATAELRIGEALQRTIRIEAHGLDAGQLPPSDLRAEGFSVHPASPRLENRFDGEWNVGVREQSWRIVPSRAGKLIVPEVRVHWWDAAAGQPRLATLPAHTFSVAGETAADVRGAAEVQPAPRGGAEVPDTDKDGRLLPAAGVRGSDLPPAARFAALAAVFAALAGSVTRLRRNWQRGAPLRALRAACRRNDPRAARDALLVHAARCGGPPPRSLGELAAHVADAGTRDAILTLDRHLYGVPAERWDGCSLLACIPALRTKAPFRPPSRAAGLPPLYPE
ncbi:BatD family protein [Aromatoleum sp.]|uniref:BatD family protein n=1 Tax=Aromatoleum sp. TaxID=2307007 RepID=UPI002FC7D90E